MKATIQSETPNDEDVHVSSQVLLKCRPGYLGHDFIVADVSFDPVRSSWFVDLHASNWHGTILDETPLEGSESGTIDFRGVLNRLGYTVEDGRVH